METRHMHTRMTWQMFACCAAILLVSMTAFLFVAILDNNRYMPVKVCGFIGCAAVVGIALYALIRRRDLFTGPLAPAVVLYIAFVGASCFWATSGRFAIEEYAKLLAAFAAFTAACLVVRAMGTRALRRGLQEGEGRTRAVRGIFSILALIGAYFALVSLDVLSLGPLSTLYREILGALGSEVSLASTDFSESGLWGIIGNHNVLAGFLALATLAALHLTLTAARTSSRIASLVLLAMDATTLLLTASLGALFFFLLACVCYLIIVPQGVRPSLLFVMIETAALSCITAAFCFDVRETAAIALVPLLLGNCVVLCLVDAGLRLLARRIPRGAAHGRLRRIAPVVLVALALVYVFAVIFADGNLLPAVIEQRFNGSLWDTSVNLRFKEWTWALALFLRRPLIGLGLGGFQNGLKSVASIDYETKYAHNQYLETLCDTGIIGCALFLAILAAAVLVLRRGMRDDRCLAAAFAALMVQMFGSGLTDVVWSMGGTLTLYFLVLGALSGAFGLRCSAPVSVAVSESALGSASPVAPASGSTSGPASADAPTATLASAATAISSSKASSALTSNPAPVAASVSNPATSTAAPAPSDLAFASAPAPAESAAASALVPSNLAPASVSIISRVILLFALVTSALFALLLVCNIRGNYLLAHKPTNEQLVSAIATDRFDGDSYRITYLLRSLASDDEAVIAQAARYAEDVRDIESNSAPLYLARYYYGIGAYDTAFDVLEEGIEYVKAGGSEWQAYFDLYQSFLDPTVDDVSSVGTPGVTGGKGLELLSSERATDYTARVLQAYQRFAEVNDLLEDTRTLDHRTSVFISRLSLIDDGMDPSTVLGVFQ